MGNNSYLLCLLKWSGGQYRQLHCSRLGMAETPQSLCEPRGCGRTPLCQSRTPLQPPWMQPPLLCHHCCLQMTHWTEVLLFDMIVAKSTAAFVPVCAVWPLFNLILN